MSTLFERIGEGQYAKLITAVGGTVPAPKPAPLTVTIKRMPRAAARKNAAHAMAQVAKAPIPGTAAYAAEARRG